MPEPPSASIVIPSRLPGDYLDTALASVVPQARAANAEVIVVSDGPSPAAAEIARRHGAQLVFLPERRGVNGARNAGIDAAQSDLLVFIDQDVETPPGWLDAVLVGADSNPDRAVFGGPIVARLEGGGPRSCGRESPPITTLDFGAEDRDVPLVWGTNMAIRRCAFDRVGKFDGNLSGRGDEEEWEVRWKEAGGRIRYLPRAGLDHRRTSHDARLRSLAQVAYRHGREARRHDVRRDTAPAFHREVRVLAGCVWHVLRRRCPNGIVMAAASAGRLRETLAERRAPRHRADYAASLGPLTDRPKQDDFLSGTSGEVSGIRATARALVEDARADLSALARVQRWRLRRAAGDWPIRRVLVLGIERTGTANLLADARRELLRSRHEIRFAAAPVAGRGKFENLNLLLSENPVEGRDWLIVVDDDVRLPRDFLDTFIFLAERFQFRLAQPAHIARSHAAWHVTRRRAGTIARETRYVEIGPVVAFHHVTFDTILPFPQLRIGWGLDLHWSAIAWQHGWRAGVIDATPIRHGLRPIASSYDRSDAVAEARRFLAARPYTSAVDAQTTLVTHQTWR